MTSRKQMTVGTSISFALLIVSALLSPAADNSADTAVLQAEIRRIAVFDGGEVGVAARRLDGVGPRVLLNADQPFPMASTFKIAVAGALLAKVDAGALSLDKMLPVDVANYVESEIIAEALIHPGVSLSVQNLLELMLTRSDNTATDVLTAAVGGPEVVTAWVRKTGISGLRVDRDTSGILRDFFQLPSGIFSQALAAARKADPKIEERGTHSNAAYDDDPRDTSTPTAMAELLAKIFTGRAPLARQYKSADRHHGALPYLRDNRIRARLPAGTVVADKTGTLGGSVNDVGVITLPESKGQVVIAVFIKKSDLPFVAREKVIADLSRAICDYFLFLNSGSIDQRSKNDFALHSRDPSLKLLYCFFV
jgi:beta-lactamase class A